MCCPAGMDPQRESTLRAIGKRLLDWTLQGQATDETSSQLLAVAARTPTDQLQSLLVLAGEDDGSLVRGLQGFLSGLCIYVRAGIT